MVITSICKDSLCCLYRILSVLVLQINLNGMFYLRKRISHLFYSISCVLIVKHGELVQRVLIETVSVNILYTQTIRYYALKNRI
jgi:hypothetical protein